MQMSGQMLQEEGHALVNDRLFYHLIIVQHEDDGSRMRRLSFQLMEKHGKTGGKRRWPGRLQLGHPPFPQDCCPTRAAAQGPGPRAPEGFRVVRDSACGCGPLASGRHTSTPPRVASASGRQ